MNSTYKKYSALLVTALVIFGLALPHITYAWDWGISDLALLLPGYIVSWIVLPVMSLLVYISGMLLNLSINMSVVNMADNVKAAGINEIWKVIRDVANMGFIFVLIYTAIMTIFGKGDYQKVIKNVVIGALLINFSLFITKAIIDASNLVALFFYNAISPGGISVLKGISSSFMDVLGITNLYKGAGNFEGTKLVIIGLGGAVVYLITSFSFLAVAALFIIRFIILMLLMVLSPLMFIGSIIPGVSDKAKEWWDALISQSLFGPVYFMLTWVTLKITQQMFTIGSGDFGGTGTTTASIASALTGLESGGTYTANSGSAEVLMKFIIVIAFMIASLLTAKKIAEKAGGAATKTAFAWAGGATLGLAGRAGRGTIGRAGSALANSETVKNAIERGGASGMAGRLALATGKKASSSSWDARGAFGLGKALGAGTPAKKASFDTDVKKRTENATAMAKHLKPSDIESKKIKDREAAATNELEAHITARGYVIPPELAAARREMEEAEKATGKGSDERKKQAKKKLEEAEGADRSTRLRYTETDTRAKELYLAAEKIRKTRTNMESRQSRYIEKQAEPFIGTKSIGTLAGPTANRVSHAASDTASNVRDRVNEIGNPVIRTAAKPLSWLATMYEKTVQTGAKVVNMRQEERDARVAAIRKELNKSKEDKDREELIKAAREGAKEGAKKDDDE